jgi:D-2-hydroxyacid dehydrogenase (NADP+)
MKRSAYLLNAARGRVVDEPALVDALTRRQIRGAALDVMVEEPLPAASPLWSMENVLITPHTAGETCRYEDSVLAIMQGVIGAGPRAADYGLAGNWLSWCSARSP